MSRYNDALRHIMLMDSLGLDMNGNPHNDDADVGDDEPLRDGFPTRDYDSQGNPTIVVQVDEKEL